MQKTSVANVGKVPGAIHEVNIDDTKPKSIKEIFKELNIGLDKCEIQKNGIDVNEDEVVEVGDNVLAITKIKGN